MSTAECPRCRDWGKFERHEDHQTRVLVAVDPEHKEAPPPCQTGSDGASRPERGQP